MNKMIDEVIHYKISSVKNIETQVTEVNKAHQATSKGKSDEKPNSARQSHGVKIAHVLKEFWSSITGDSLENTPITSRIVCPDRPTVSKRRLADMAEQIITEENCDFQPCIYAVDDRYDKYYKDPFNPKTRWGVIEMMKHDTILFETDDNE